MSYLEACREQEKRYHEGQYFAVAALVGRYGQYTLVLTFQDEAQKQIKERAYKLHSRNFTLIRGAS